MINELCVFNTSKVCDNCGDCDICELNTSKLCDNCGKCLNLSDSEMRSININTLFNTKAEKEEGVEADLEEAVDYSIENLEDDYNDNYSNEEEGEGDYENLEEWILIDDLEEVGEYEDSSLEAYPGLIRIDTRRK